VSAPDPGEKRREIIERNRQQGAGIPPRDERSDAQKIMTGLAADVLLMAIAIVLLGAAAILAPIAIPVVVIVGVGYGIYRLLRRRA
jgi:hypothetical protein